VPSCGPSSRGVRGSLGGCIVEGEKSYCCVTTRRRNFWLCSSLRSGLHSLAARFFRLSVPGFGVGMLAGSGLPLCRLPAADLQSAFRILAIALVPTPRLVLALTSFAQANPWARSALPGPTVMFSRTLASAHGRCFSQGKARGECPTILSERYQNANETLPRQSIGFPRTRQRTKRLEK
jgi:hypothetical protein